MTRYLSGLDERLTFATRNHHSCLWPKATLFEKTHRGYSCLKVKKKRSDQRPQYLKSHKFEILAILPLVKVWISSYQGWVFLTFTYLIWPVLLNICCCPWPYPDKMSLITLHRLPADRGLHFIWCPGTRVDNMLWKIKGNTVWHIHHTNILYSIWYFNNHFFIIPLILRILLRAFFLF